MEISQRSPWPGAVQFVCLFLFCLLSEFCLDCKNKKLMKGKALRKHSLHEKTAASVLLKLFISGNEWCQSELLCQFRLIGDRASDVSDGRICLTQNAYTKFIVLTETYESRSAITNQSEHLEQRAFGTTRPIPTNRRSCKV